VTRTTSFINSSAGQSRPRSRRICFVVECLDTWSKSSERGKHGFDGSQRLNSYRFSRGPKYRYIEPPDKVEALLSLAVGSSRSRLSVWIC
jgi:hypothetical protein